MLQRIITFVVVAVVVYLVCIFVGGLLLTLNLSISTFVGSFLKEFALAISVIAGLWYAIVGLPWFPVV